MISNDEELLAALQAIGLMYRAMASLRKDVLPKSRQWFTLMAEGPVDEIRKLKEQIDEYTGLAAAQVYDSDAWLAIFGPPQDWPEAPMSIVTALLDALRNGVHTVAELAATEQQIAHAPDELERACDLRIVAFRVRGPCIGVRVPDDSELDGSGHDEPSLVRRAMGRLLQVAEWVGSAAPPEALESLCPGVRERRVILESLRPLVPGPGGEIERLEIGGRAAPSGRTISLTIASHQRIHRAIDGLAPEPTEVAGPSAVAVGRARPEGYSGNSWS
jgi:hypothetical protein